MVVRTGEQGFEGFSDEAFEFYEALTADNSKAFWTAHKHVYDDAVRAPMLALLDAVAPVFDATPTLFRPYRDVRFSADKSPYKTVQGAYLEVAAGVGYWIQLGADGLWLGGGFHAHEKSQITRYRTAVDDATIGAALTKVVAKLAKAGYEIGGATVKTRPRGVAADHPRLELMRHESLTVSRQVAADERVTVASVTSDWMRVKPLVDWVRTHATP